MRKNKLREILNNDQPSFATHVHSTWPSVIEAVGHTGVYDYVEFVAEYVPYDLYDLDNMCRAAELHDLDMMIKVDYEAHQLFAQRAVGSGFGSVLFADCHSLEDAKTCIASVRPDTPEDGGRHGVGTRRMTYMGYGGSSDYVQALRDVVVMLMIEKKGAVDDLEAILSLPGIDMIQWGGSDYSMNVGKAGQRQSAEIKEVEEYVITTALKHGVQPRAEIGTPEQAEYYMNLGVKHFCIGTDLFILYQWLRENGESLRELVSSA